MTSLGADGVGKWLGQEQAGQQQDQGSRCPRCQANSSLSNQLPLQDTFTVQEAALCTD